MQPDKIFLDVFIYLAAAVITVPLAKRLGFVSVLGYLIAGLVIGPFGLGVVHDQGHDVMHFAEFGVVMMLFLIGLELEPAWLWKLRRTILGLGGIQVGMTAVVIGGIALAAGLTWQTSLAVGLILALSSTAIILQTLTEKGLVQTSIGQSSFSVLLFQDMAVIPILAILPFLVPAGSAVQSQQIQILGYTLSGWQQSLLIIGAVAGIGVGGRYLIRPIFHFVAETRIREVFTATALLLIIGTALLMQWVGLSPALGTFLAGVVLADSEYRHELESDIQPFKGLLLGVFFIAVGAGMDLGLLWQNKYLILLLVLGLMLAKFLVLLVLALVFRQDKSDRLLFALSLSQGGEFAFVLFAFAMRNNVMSQSLAELLILVVALSMLLTPLVMMAYEKLTGQQSEQIGPADKIEEKDNPVLIAGFGRFGQIIGRFLNANRVGTTVLDLNPNQIEVLRKLGMKVYYGDASRVELLRAAGAEKARLLIVAVDEMDKCLDIIKNVQRHFPHLQILARAHNRRHYFELLKLGVQYISRETFLSSLSLGERALRLMGFRGHQAHRAAKIFSQHDEHSIRELLHIAGDEKAFFGEARRRADDLNRVIQEDHEDKALAQDSAWETGDEAVKQQIAKSGDDGQ